MDSVLSLDDGRWLHPAENSRPPSSNEAREDLFRLSNIHQPCPAPVLARIQNDPSPIPPSKVADPRPGPANSSQDGMPNSSSYQHLHIVGPLCCSSFFFLPSWLLVAYGHYAIIQSFPNWCAFCSWLFLLNAFQPVRLMEDFLRLARANTEKYLETCAILAGSLVNMTSIFLFFP